VRSCPIFVSNHRHYGAARALECHEEIGLKRNDICVILIGNAVVFFCKFDVSGLVGCRLCELTVNRSFLEFSQIMEAVKIRR